MNHGKPTKATMTTPELPPGAQSVKLPFQLQPGEDIHRAITKHYVLPMMLLQSADYQAREDEGSGFLTEDERALVSMQQHDPAFLLAHWQEAEGSSLAEDTALLKKYGEALKLPIRWMPDGEGGRAADLSNIINAARKAND